MNTIRIFSHHVHVKFVLLGILHVVAMMGCVLAAVYLRFVTYEHAVVTSAIELVLRALVFALIMMVSFAAMGLYRVQREPNSASMMARVIAGLFFGALLAFVIYYIVPQLFVGRGVMAIAWLLSLIVVGIIQQVFDRTALHSGDLWRVLLYGAGNNAAELLAFMRRRSDRALFRLAGCVVLEDEAPRVDAEMQCRLDRSLRDHALAHGIDEIVIAMDDRRRNFPANELVECRIAGINVVDTVSFYERQTGKVKTELLQPSWIIFSDGFRQNTVDHLIKRVLDLAAATILLLVLWPFMLAAGAAIKLTEGLNAPVFYRQTRVGQYGRHFSIVKFRSMRTDAEAASGAQWAVDNDPRITRVGHYLRKLRIDELPQLWNVFRGDMSLVGPRPERPEFVSRLNTNLPYYRVREVVRPGVTGWAQLGYPYGASEEDANAKLQFDLYYVKNWSLFLDLLILVNTIEVVLFRKGSR